MARPTPLNALKTAIKKGGPSQAKFAAKIGKKQSYVSMLLHRLKNEPRTTRIDVEICPLIEAATNGEVTRQQLRPDFPWQATQQDQRSAA